MRSLMIVDDEKNIRYGLKTMIEREFPDQYEIRLAPRGRKRWILTAQCRPISSLQTSGCRSWTGYA